MDIALETDSLGKRYGRIWALRDCSFQLPAGRVAALVGPNGAGKSTLLHLAVGLLRPDAGQVRVFGREPRGNTAALAEIGFVAQDTPLYPDFTAAELITMGGKLNRQWDAALARERLAQLGTAQLIPQSVDTSKCEALSNQFQNKFSGLTFVAILFVILPQFVGLFFGAPLVSREVEHGTHRLVWTQGYPPAP